MKRFPTALMLYAACAALFCSRHPSGPTADPSDAAIELFAGGTNCTVETGTPLKMGLAVSHPLFIDTIHLTSSCGGFDTTLSPDLVETADTLYFNLVFTRGGSCAVYAKAILYGAHYGEKTDSLSVEVRAKPPTVTLLVAPLIFAPTKDRFEVNAVAADGDPKTLRLFVQRSVDKGWTEVETVRYPAFDIAEWSVTDLSPGTVYPYAIVTEEDALKALEGVAAEPGTDGTPHPGLLFLGKAVTQREPGESFRFALIADSHLRPHEVTPGLDILAAEEGTLLSVVKDIEADHPDFIIHLGDVLDFHDYGFNDPPPSGDVTRWGYLNYRRLLADMIGNAAHFMVIGNWDGESGDYSEDEIDRSREQRLLYAPGPGPSTYPQGGSPHEDYYAFTWGDALFIVLNVMTYTPTAHLLDGVGTNDDWTLGEEQLNWLTKTLEAATARWRFILIHHAVGGLGGTNANSIYGRGGGRAACVGEQAIVHQLMLEHGVQIFFYGHDHVFTDMVVDGIHYTLPGSAGAPWKFGTQETGYTEYRTESGHALVTVTPQNVLVEFIAQGGEVIDRYTVE